MKKYFALYTPEGVIDSIFSGPESLASVQGLDYLEDDGSASCTAHYVSFSGAEPEVVSRSPRDVSHTVSLLTAVFTGLPAGTYLEVEGAGITTDDQPTEIEFELPGTYTIRLSGLVEYLDEELEVTVNG